MTRARQFQQRDVGIASPPCIATGAGRGARKFKTDAGNAWRGDGRMASQRRHSQTHRQIFSGVHLGRSRFWVDENARGQRGGGRYGHQCEKGCHVFVVLGPLSQKTRVRGLQ